MNEGWYYQVQHDPLHIRKTQSTKVPRWSEGYVILLQHRAPLVSSKYFSDVMNVKKSTGLWDAELAWYSPWATHLVYLNGANQNFAINSLCILVLAWSSKFLQSEQDFWNDLVTVPWSNAFLSFPHIFQFEPVKYKFLNESLLNIHQFGFQIIHGVSNPQRFSTPSNTLLLIAVNCFGLWYIYRTLACTKILQNFWLTLALKVTSVQTEIHLYVVYYSK